MRKTIVRATWIALIVLLLGASVAQAKAMYVKEAAKLYKSYALKSAVIAELTEGQQVDLLAVKKSWAKVKASGKVGFVKKSVLAKKPAQPGGGDQTPQDGETMYASQKIKLFKRHAADAKVVCAIPFAAKLTVYSRSGAWAKVAYGGKTGYVKKDKLVRDEPIDEEPNLPGEPDVPGEPNLPGEPDAPAEDGVTLKPGDAGEKVMKLQRRLKALDWFYGDIGGNYQALTTQAVKDFQEAAGLSATGIADAKTQKKLYASNAPKNVLDNNGKPASGRAVQADWWTSDIQNIFPRGKTATVTDVETGLTWQEYRAGGTNHADVQPKTAQDAALMNKAYGGTWSWNRRAIWVSIGGVKYAASMNGMPHGSGSIEDNNFDGHHCIHFTNSRTHGSNQIDARHPAAIQTAHNAG
ncbi:MAG: peptidoglycan-binding domain-containing protein [Clostridia bacterium]